MKQVSTARTEECICSGAIYRTRIRIIKQFNLDNKTMFLTT